MEYKVIKEIGRGGFGVVELVEDETTGKHYAKKRFEIHPSMKDIEDLAKKRFIKEALYQSEFDHPNIVKILEVYTDEDPPYYIMPLAECTLHDEMKHGAIDFKDFENAYFDILAGLEEMHGVSMYHRDLKPANVLKFGDRYAVGDFGLVSLDLTGVTTITTTGVAKGSDLYTAPEITSDLRRSSIQSDIYSLGCILHDFVQESKRVACHEISEVSPYGDILRSSTRLDPTRRFKSVSSFREALIDVLADADPKLKSEIALEVSEILQREVEEFNEEGIQKLADFLGSSVADEEKEPILRNIKSYHIRKIIMSKHHNVFIAKIYMKYVRTHGFSWGFCDTLANRVQDFMEINTVDIVSEGILALLYLGTNHNRYYVERLTFGYLKGELEPSLLKRLLIEIRIEDKRFIRAIDHLCHSIDKSHDELNSRIREMYDRISGK